MPLTVKIIFLFDSDYRVLKPFKQSFGRNERHTVAALRLSQGVFPVILPISKEVFEESGCFSNRRYMDYLFLNPMNAPVEDADSGEANKTRGKGSQRKNPRGLI
jgi:hypothetical protein